MSWLSARRVRAQRVQWTSGTAADQYTFFALNLWADNFWADNFWA